MSLSVMLGQSAFEPPAGTLRRIRWGKPAEIGAPSEDDDEEVTVKRNRKSAEKRQAEIEEHEKCRETILSKITDVHTTIQIALATGMSSSKVSAHLAVLVNEKKVKRYSTRRVTYWSLYDRKVNLEKIESKVEARAKKTKPKPKCCKACGQVIKAKK